MELAPLLQDLVTGDAQQVMELDPLLHPPMFCLKGEEEQRDPNGASAPDAPRGRAAARRQPEQDGANQGPGVPRETQIMEITEGEGLSEFGHLFFTPSCSRKVFALPQGLIEVPKHQPRTIQQRFYTFDKVPHVVPEVCTRLAIHKGKAETEFSLVACVV